MVGVATSITLSASFVRSSKSLESIDGRDKRRSQTSCANSGASEAIT